MSKLNIMPSNLWSPLVLKPNLTFQTTKVCQLTGTEDREASGKPTGAELSGVTGGVTGTDLGFQFEYNEKVQGGIRRMCGKLSKERVEMKTQVKVTP